MQNYILSKNQLPNLKIDFKRKIALKLKKKDNNELLRNKI